MSLLKLQQIHVELHTAALLKDISLVLNSGELLAVIGPNGAGKSSLLKAACGDLPLSRGAILVKNNSLSYYRAEELAQQLAVLPQSIDLDFPFVCRDVVAMGRIPHSTGAAIDARIVAEVLQELDIEHLAQRLYTELSGGEKQRVQLARVLVQIWGSEGQQDNLLLLDEPCAWLDVAHSHQLMKLLRRRVAVGAGVMMVLHDFNLAAAYATRVAVIKSGELLALGTPTEVFTEALMREVFSVSARVLRQPDSDSPMICITE